MKKLSIFLMLAMFIIGSAVSASAFSLGGYSGPIKMKFSNWEDLILPAANMPGPSYYVNNGDGIEDNYGILYITDIRADDGSNLLLWSDATQGETLTGLFYDVDVQSWAPNGSGGTNVQSVGGKMDIYLDTSPSGTFDATQGNGGYIADADGIAHNDYTGITDIGSTLFLTLDFVPGVDILTDATIDGDFDGSTLPASGDATSYLSVTGGAYASTFDTNGFSVTYTDDILGPGTSITPDFFTQNDFVPNDGSTAPIQGDWGLLSEDPNRGNAAIPEPSTIMLFGLGLLGLGFVGRKKLTHKD